MFFAAGKIRDFTVFDSRARPSAAATAGRVGLSEQRRRDVRPMRGPVLRARRLLIAHVERAATGDLMRRRCPHCKSLDVRRRVTDPRDAHVAWFRSRFRCRDCKESFWMMNHKAYRLLGLFVRVNAAFFAVIAALLFVYRS